MSLTNCGADIWSGYAGANGGLIAAAQGKDKALRPRLLVGIVGLAF
jgi:hypothetical protein